MRSGELLTKTIATYDQVDRWINQGCSIGVSLPRGATTIRDFTELDAKICNVLVYVSDLIGSGPRAPACSTILRRITTQLKDDQTLLRRKNLYINRVGIITDKPSFGWVVPIK